MKLKCSGTYGKQYYMPLFRIQMTMFLPRKKVLFVGNGFSGKTVIAKKLTSIGSSTISFTLAPEISGHTMGASVYEYTSHKGVYRIYDCGSQVDSRITGEYEHADIAFIFTSEDIDPRIVDWGMSVLNVCPNIRWHITTGSLDKKFETVKCVLG